jgi:hypothetical protein
MAGQNKGDGAKNKTTTFIKGERPFQQSRVTSTCEHAKPRDVELEFVSESADRGGDFQIMKSVPIFTRYVWPPTSLQLLSQGVS